MEVKASKCFFDAEESVLRRPYDTFEVTLERATFLEGKGLIGSVKKEEPKEKRYFNKEK